jgi:hypothetical protein
MPGLYQAQFASTDDPELDGETTLLEDAAMTLDDIVAASRKYKVRAKVIEDGKLVASVVPPDELPSSARTALTNAATSP